MTAALTRLPDPAQHCFTSDDFDAEEVEAVAVAYGGLKALPRHSVDELVAFLKAWNEVDEFVGEAGSRLHLESAQHTDREDARERFLAFNRDVQTRVSEWEQELRLALLDSPALAELDDTDYAPFIRQVRIAVELFRPENIPLFKDLAELDNQYGEISGAWTVELDGKTLTLSEVAGLLESPDRALRQRAWTARMARCHQDAERLDELWSQMYDLRQQAAANAGFADFRDFIFKAKMRDYGPDACFAYHELVEAEVVPLVQAIDAQKKAELGVERYRPWDTQAEPPGREALKPFEEVARLTGGVERMMRRLDAELGDVFQQLVEYMDLGARPNKRQGGFMLHLDAARRPFIFANASGRQSDLVTLLHESGHAFHSVLAHGRKPMRAASVPMEFNEVASMAMELLHFDTLDEFYDAAQREQAMKQHLRRIPRVLAAVAQGDSFQHWLYTHPEHTAEQRHERWLYETERFAGHIDTAELDRDWLKTRWHQVLHFFVVPFYYIEYGFAYLGALQVASAYERDPAAALDAYKGALRLGPTRDVAGLYAAAGAQFVPTQERVRRLMDWVRQKLEL